jgi:replicative DNA helicase
MVQSFDDARRRRQQTGGGDSTRVPPHNLQAEESLLGAMLLSRDAIVSAVEIQLGPADFYKPAHGHVFDAITSLYAQGEPADPVTVAEELRRAGLLEAVGGPAILVSLQANTPAIGNAGRYARIVEEHALLRRLIGVAGDIAEMGYSVPDDVSAAIDQAEALVFDVAQRRVTDSLASIRDLLERHLDHIEALYERGQDITGVPTGYLDLDQQLAGLQPSNLIIVGGRPGTGKALALDTPIPTPTGWTTMGELRVGDEVLDDQGRPCRVTFATPVMHGRPCYEVTFDDGSTIVADGEHQWFAYDLPAWNSRRERHYRLSGRHSHIPERIPKLARDQIARWKLPRVVTTDQMIDEGVLCRDQRPNWYIALTAPLDLPEKDLRLDPYLLGVWLGDGHSSGAAITTEDPEIVAAFESHGCRLRQQARAVVTDLAAQYGFTRHDYVLSAVKGTGGRHADDAQPSFAAALIDLRVIRNKHIPSAYLRSSREQRLALLQGLLDADGTVSASGAVELCLADRRLVAQARELVCSLGHRPGQIRQKLIPLADGRTTVAWRFSWVPLDNVFHPRRKAVRLASSRRRLLSGRATRRAIVSIAPVSSVPVRCIAVDSPRHMYLAGESMIPTHNTSFALGIVSHAALETRTPVLLFSLEMSHLELTQRMLCAEARVDATRMRNGRLLESDWPKISHAVGRLAEAPIYIDDNPHLTVMEIRAKARRLKSRAGLGLIVVDYLQLMTGRPNAENRQVEVSEISRGLKILARELGVPVIALSQLSRNLEARADKRPVLADLRESGSLEQDSDVVIFLYRDEVYNRDSPDRGTAEVIVAKHRNGPTGVTQLAFLDHYTRFANMARGV